MTGDFTTVIMPTKGLPRPFGYSRTSGHCVVRASLIK